MKLQKTNLFILALILCVAGFAACNDIINLDDYTKKGDNVSDVIDSIKIIPKNISVSDSVLFATFSEPFGGDCTYQLNIDSIIDTKIYISGKFESDAKCMYKGANDTINIGLFPAGTYKIIYKFIDIKIKSANDVVPNVPTETYSTTFVVF